MNTINLILGISFILGSISMLIIIHNDNNISNKIVPCYDRFNNEILNTNCIQKEKISSTFFSYLFWGLGWFLISKELFWNFVLRSKKQKLKGDDKRE